MIKEYKFSYVQWKHNNGRDDDNDDEDGNSEDTDDNAVWST